MLTWLGMATRIQSNRTTHVRCPSNHGVVAIARHLEKMPSVTMLRLRHTGGGSVKATGHHAHKASNLAQHHQTSRNTATAASNSGTCSTSIIGDSEHNNIKLNPFAGFSRQHLQKVYRSQSRAASLASSTSSTTSGSRCANICAAAMTEAPGSVMKTVEVSLGDRSYPIYIGNNLLEGKGELLRQHIPGKKVLIVTNETIAPLYLDRTIKALTADGKISVETVILPDGEEHKTLDVVSKVWDKALETRLDRGVTFLALGGGVIGDMTGFAAACYQRGVHFVQVPTTVMSQVDSSVGGKTGVNHPLGKNMVGAFYQPRVVLVDTDTLATLPDRELASGISEIVKYGLIRDADLFNWLEANMHRLLARDPEAIAYAVERSCINKAEVVAADERETNDVRATLNLGHTFGHAIETGTGYGTLLHGEAVSIGMVMAADLSYRMGWIDKSILDRTRAVLVAARLPVEVPPPMTTQLFMDLMSVDKKVAAGKLRLILLKGPLGNCVVTGDFDPAKLKETLESFTAHLNN